MFGMLMCNDVGSSNHIRTEAKQYAFFQPLSPYPCGFDKPKFPVSCNSLTSITANTKQTASQNDGEAAIRRRKDNNFVSCIMYSKKLRKGKFY